MEVQCRCFICNEIRNPILILLWAEQQENTRSTVPICSFACFEKLISEYYEARKEFIEYLKNEEEMKNGEN